MNFGKLAELRPPRPLQDTHRWCYCPQMLSSIGNRSAASKQARLDPALAAEVLHILREGSKSFHVAGRLLGPVLRERFAAVYAFCRVADDAVDEAEHIEAALEALGELRLRLDRVYAGRATERVDRALLQVVQATGLPRAPFDFLLEGFAWDLEGRRYPDRDALLRYCVRVASTVGVLCAWLLEARRPFELARAADLGIAMQLTNIARDIGEDARRGRIYIPLDWCEAEGLDVEAWLTSPRPNRRTTQLCQRLEAEAEHYYLRGDQGLAYLSGFGRWSIVSARLIYAGIHQALRRQAHDAVSLRAVTGDAFKLQRAVSALTYAPPRALHLVSEAATRELVDAIAT